MAQPAVQPKRFGRVPLRLLDDTINGRLTSSLLCLAPCLRIFKQGGQRRCLARLLLALDVVALSSWLPWRHAMQRCSHRRMHRRVDGCLVPGTSLGLALKPNSLKTLLVLGLPHPTRLGDLGVSLESGGGGLLSGPRRAGRFPRSPSTGDSGGDGGLAIRRRVGCRRR